MLWFGKTLVKKSRQTAEKNELLILSTIDLKPVYVSTNFGTTVNTNSRKDNLLVSRPSKDLQVLVFGKI